MPLVRQYGAGWKDRTLIGRNGYLKAVLNMRGGAKHVHCPPILLQKSISFHYMFYTFLDISFMVCFVLNPVHDDVRISGFVLPKIQNRLK